MIIAIIVFVLVWIWCIWEWWNTPLMPDDYDEHNDPFDAMF